MSGESNLQKLLQTMKPELKTGEFVFVTLSKAQAEPLAGKAMMLFQEAEGVTLILDVETAKANNLAYDATWALITMTVHSDLQAVGFLAVLTKSLAAEAISVNAVSAYYHDHLFVPFEKRNEAISIIENI